MDAAAINNLNEMVAKPVRIVMGTMVRGLLISSPGVQPHIVMNAIAWQIGNMLASSIQSDNLPALLQLRKGFTDAFNDGMAKGKIIAPEMPKG